MELADILRLSSSRSGSWLAAPPTSVVVVLDGGIGGSWLAGTTVGGTVMVESVLISSTINVIKECNKMIKGTNEEIDVKL